MGPTVALYLGILAALVFSPLTIGAPVEAVAEERSVEARPHFNKLVPRVIEAFLDCTGIEEICDADCYAILCKGQNRVLTRVDPDQKRKNYQASGAAHVPFKKSEQQMEREGVDRPDNLHISAEEYPFESSREGGRGADLFPMTENLQNNQGIAIGKMYTNYGIENGTQYRLNFANANTPYCVALAAGDFSVCNTHKKGEGDWGYDVADFAYVRASLPGQRYIYDAVGKQHLGPPSKKEAEGEEEDSTDPEAKV